MTSISEGVQMVSIRRAFICAILAAGTLAGLGCAASGGHSLDDLATQEPTQSAVDEALSKGGVAGHVMVIGLLETEWDWLLYDWKDPTLDQLGLRFWEMGHETSVDGTLIFRPTIPRVMSGTVTIRDRYIIEWARRAHPEKCMSQGD